MKIAIRADWERRPPAGGVAVVIDVIRFSTTLCALMRAGRRSIWAAREPRELVEVENISASDIFSELDVPPIGRRFDNSPSKALEMDDPDRAAYVTTTSGSKALCACRGASRTLAGCFANFDAVLRLLRSHASLRRGDEPLWLIPAAGSRGRGCLEDNLCANSFRDSLNGDDDAAAKAVAAVLRSSRIAEFLKFRPSKDGRKDLELCLGLNSLSMVPQADYGTSTASALVFLRPATAIASRQK